jgi:DNA-binding transcriptional MerR regulator
LKARPKLRTIKQAAEILGGVAEVTHRRWSAAGKCRARRRTTSKYHVYTAKDVLRLRNPIRPGRTA